ncbi:MAG: hypothetical protein H6834_11340 [Planctomycetes bacterium]|nr:hypothetical protein [Planctomycetota bacterium]
MPLEQALLVACVNRYLDGLLDPFLSVRELAILVDFLHAASEPTSSRAPARDLTDPLAPLRRTLQEMEGTSLTTRGTGPQEPDEHVTLLPGALAQARSLLVAHPETRRCFDRVSRLVEGFESPFGLELLATVRAAMTRAGSCSKDDLVRLAQASPRRAGRFTRRQLLLAFERWGGAGLVGVA